MKFILEGNQVILREDDFDTETLIKPGFKAPEFVVIEKDDIMKPVTNPEFFMGPQRSDGEWYIGATRAGELIYYQKFYDQIKVTKDFQHFKYCEDYEFGEPFAELNDEPKKATIDTQKRKIVLSDGTEIHLPPAVSVQKINDEEYLLSNTYGIQKKINIYSVTESDIEDVMEAVKRVQTLYEDNNMFVHRINSNYEGDWLAVLQKLLQAVKNHKIDKKFTPIRVSPESNSVRFPQGTIIIDKWPTDQKTREIFNSILQKFFSGPGWYVTIRIKNNDITIERGGHYVLRVPKDKSKYGEPLFIYNEEHYDVNGTKYHTEYIEVNGKEFFFMPLAFADRIKNFAPLNIDPIKPGVHHGKKKDYVITKEFNYTVPYNDGIYRFQPFVGMTEKDIESLQKPEYIREYERIKMPRLDDVAEIRYISDKYDAYWIYKSFTGTVITIRNDIIYHEIRYKGKELTKEQKELLETTHSIDSLALSDL